MRRPGPRKWEFSLGFCPGAVTKVKPSPVGRQKESQAKGPISQFCGDEDMLGANIICQAAPVHQMLWCGLYQEGLSSNVIDIPKGINW